MTLPPHTPAVQLSDLRGAAALTVDAVTGLTDLVEAMHAGIARAPVLRHLGIAGERPARTRGVTAWVYRTIRGVTHLAGEGTDRVLVGLASLRGTATPAESAHLGRSAVLAALNGVFGDHLAATGNPLALPMDFRAAGQSLVLRRTALAAALPQATPQVLVLIHGLCMNDAQWLRDGHHHGERLAQALGYTPVHLRYNTGLSVAANGRLLARRMEQLLAAWPVPVQRLAVVGHSMGGLVARSAIHHAVDSRGTALAWPQRLDDLICVGTPHLGAPLERAGHGVDRLLEALPFAAPLARIGKARSAGITDLRDGRLTAPRGAARGSAIPATVPLPQRTRCYALAGTLGATLGSVGGPVTDQLLGDGLVTVSSALGQHADPARCLDFPPAHRVVVPDTGHLDLLSSPVVEAHLLRWLR